MKAKLKDGQEVEIIANVNIPNEDGVNREHVIIDFGIARYVKEGVVSRYGIISKNYVDF